MIDHMLRIVNEERMKDLRREADNERLAHKVADNENDVLRNVRNIVGRSLVAVGKQLLDDEKQR
jgi:hypothetical protein